MKLLNNLSVFIAIMFTFKVNTINTIGNAVCMWIDLENNNLVDLKNLKRKGDNDLFIDFKFKKSNYLLAYNFCEDTIAINGNYKSSQMSLLNKEYEFQRIFSGGFELGNQMKYIEGDMYNGIQLIMNQGDMCDFHGKFYSVIWDLKCSMDLPKDKNIEILSYEYDDENCKLNIKSITRESKSIIIFSMSKYE